MRLSGIIQYSGFMMIIHVFSFCNSYGLNSRIAAVLGGNTDNSGNTGGSDPNFMISSISPADGATGVSALAPVILMFSQSFQPSSLNISFNTPQCGGNIQISINNFLSCIRILSSAVSPDGKSLTLNSAGIPLGQIAKVKVLSAVTNQNGMSLAATYSSTGFQTANPPCGSGNCFLTAQTNGFATGSGALAFPVMTGPQAGKVLIVQGATTATWLYDPFTATMSPGPTITATANGALAIPLKSGPNAGKTMVFMGGVSSTNQLYDPLSNSFGAHVAACNTLTTGALAIEVLAGMHLGKYYIETANGAIACLYDPMADTFVSAAGATNTPSSGAFAIYIESGVNIGKSLVVQASATLGTLFTHSLDHLATSPTTAPLSLTAALQPNAFYIRSGAQLGQILIVNGNSGATTQWYDLAGGTFSTVAPITAPAVSCSVGASAANFPIVNGINAGKTFLLCGAGAATTSIYNPQTATFSAGPASTVPVAANSLSFQVDNGIYPGTILIVGTSNFTVYFP